MSTKGDEQVTAITVAFKISVPGVLKESRQIFLFAERGMDRQFVK